MGDDLQCDGGLAPERNALNVAGMRLSYLAWPGDGPPLVLLHGITSSARGWWRVAPQLAHEGYRVYAFDMPGHGESDETDDHAIEQLAALIGEAIRSLISEPVALVGHSWGGATTLALASTPGAPPLTRVTLIDPALRMSPERGTQAIGNFTMGIGMAPEETMPIWRANNPDWHACDVYWKAEALVHCRLRAVEGLFLHSGAWDLAGRAADVAVPLLLLLADPAYTVVPPDALAAFDAARHPERSRVVTVPGTNHNMQRGGFAKVMPILREWHVER
jgi:pimeloyl-ACP methyl ester carboxylesterase